LSDEEPASLLAFIIVAFLLLAAQLVGNQA
jgi:hypothetical protein